MAFLNEIGLERLWSHIIAKLGVKVDKENGKGLSTNDYTDEEKEKLSNVQTQVDEVEEKISTAAYIDTEESVTISN